jgi:hypothetical protein
MFKQPIQFRLAALGHPFSPWIGQYQDRRALYLIDPRSRGCAQRVIELIE